jgi:hypothetical protein
LTSKGRSIKIRNSVADFYTQVHRVKIKYLLLSKIAVAWTSQKA